MAKWAKFDFSELRRLAGAFNKALDDRVIERFMRDFLLEMAFRAERKIKKRTPVNTGHLRENWKVGRVERHGNALVVEIYNPVDYASFVEYGFRSHWVPGYWKGKSFVYDPNAETGMYVGPKDGWVPGRFMATISMQEIERELPRYLERRVMELWDGIMNGRPPRKG
jgi:hypothetical protein